MKILKWSYSDDFYLMEPLELGGIPLYRANYIKKKGEKGIGTPSLGKPYSGRLYNQRDIGNGFFKNDVEILTIKKEDTSQFIKENNLNPYILKMWISKNNDGSLTYNPRRFFTYFENALIVKRSMFGKTDPISLVKRDLDGSINFISLVDKFSSKTIRYTKAHKKVLWHMLKENNLEYRVYLSEKALQKTIQTAFKIQ